uniref:Ionotropic glutamate receptor C-terminal domain-containing protein n=1 Tax=Trichogramma kaykai TaxID=54128 RepID=A0ABD2X3B7_9HYME
MCGIVSSTDISNYNTDASRVLIVSRGARQKQQKSGESSEELENWIYSSFASRLACAWIDIDKDRVPIFLLNSNSLFLYVRVKHDDIDIKFVKNLKGLTANFPAPTQVLLIMFNRNNDFTARYQDLLEQFWQEQLVDVTIIGIALRVSPKQRRKITIDRETDYAATIHHYNPFARAHTNRALDSSSKLFPEKLDDFHGLKLRVGFVEHPPYSWRSPKSRKMTGFVGLLLETIQRKLNFSVEMDFRPMSDHGVLLANGSATGLLGEVALPKRHLDVFAYGSFLLHVDHPLLADRTTWISLERICGLVPLIKKPAFQLSSGIQWSLLVILCLVVVVWLSSVLLLGKYWRPLDIAQLMMGSSMFARATTLRERLLFGCVLVVGLFYSSSMLAHLTSLNLDMAAYKRFESYRELDESGLVPFVHPNLMNMTFRSGNDPTLYRLGRKAIQHTNTDTCLGWLLGQANVSCIMGQYRISYLLNRHGDRVKQAKPCFWTAYRAFSLRKGSPYTPSFNRIIRHVQEAKFDTKWNHLYREEASRLSDDSSSEEKRVLSDSLRDNSYRSVFVLLLAGYVLSFAVFFAELAVEHFHAKLQRQCQWLRRRKKISTK